MKNALSRFLDFILARQKAVALGQDVKTANQTAALEVVAKEVAEQEKAEKKAKKVK